jgi:hypothetical protein
LGGVTGCDEAATVTEGVGGVGGGVYTGVAGGVYTGVGGFCGGVDGFGGTGVYVTVGAGAGEGVGATCGAPEAVWKVEEPHFGQKAVPALTSELHLLQYSRGGVRERPHPVQKVSPGS